jgi:hypothetical protein
MHVIYFLYCIYSDNKIKIAVEGIVKCVKDFRMFFKGGRSANKLLKSQIRKFANLIFLRLADLPQIWQFEDLWSEGHIYF